ncbi:MAG TPA: gluconokinase [Vicinamibacteria bacterium]|nr:gluconokinase [Vicinamibacteria bacterium]
MSLDLQPPFVLAVDVGSSSVRASLYDRLGRPIEDTHAIREATLRTSADGTAEMDPHLVVDWAEQVIDEVLQRAGARGREIAAVALDTLVFAGCAVDAQGEALTPLYTYADTRAREEALELRRELDFPSVYQRTGCPLHTSYMPARVRWLRRADPQAAARVRRWLPIGSLLYGRWFGDPAVPVSYSVAAWSGLLDRQALRWDAPLLRHLGLPPEALPPLADYDQPQRGLAPEHARRWPALREVPFFLAVGDGAAANVGSGCVSPDRVALTVGTTGAMRVVLPDAFPAVPAGLWAYKVSAAETLLGGALTEGGNVFAWATSTLRLPSASELDAALEALPPDGHGLTVLPFIAGERSPGWANDAEAAIVGLHPGTTPIEVLQACLEAVAYRFAIISRLLGPHVAANHQVVASGGAMNASPFWVQLMADVLGRRVRLAGRAELTSRGTAILALRALGLWTTLRDEELALSEAYDPRPGRAPVYQAALERQHRLYASLVGLDPEIGPTISAAVAAR